MSARSLQRLSVERPSSPTSYYTQPLGGRPRAPASVGCRRPHYPQRTLHKDRKGGETCSFFNAYVALTYNNMYMFLFTHLTIEREVSVFIYVCKRGKQSRGQGRDAARKRAGAEFRKPALSRVRRGFVSEFVRNLRLAFALRRDGTAGGVRARGRRRRAPSSTPRARAAAPTTRGSGRLDRVGGGGGDGR